MPRPQLLADGDGKVAIHRWFAAGEGWDLPPWYVPRQLELLRVLDKRLKSSEEGVFTVPVFGGVLLGEKLADLHCPDVRARERKPTILRVAFFSRPPTVEQRQDL